MAWYWSDDVARAAIEAGLVTERTVQEWIGRPVAFAAEADLTPVDVAARLLGIEDQSSAGAA
jgi:hypothetical protein